MKKVISMLLLLSAAITFTACSSDDDGVSNPVTNINCPTQAKVGSEVTVQGIGFNTAGLSLYLTNADNTPYTDVTPAYTSSGATFTIPYTVPAGSTVNVVLRQGSNEWTLGTISVTAADNPITSLSLPDEMGYNAAGTATVTIGGIGFADGDQIQFTTAVSTKSEVVVTRPTVEGTVTADGLQIAVPATLEEGDYIIALVRGNNSWQLSDEPVYVYQQKQITSIAVESPYNAFYGLSVLNITLAWNTDGTLASVSSSTSEQFSGLNYTFAYDGDKVTATASDGTQLVYTMQNGVVVSSTDPYANTTDEKYPDEPNSTWTYDSDNHVISVTNGSKWYQGASLTAEYTEGSASMFSLGGEMELKYDKTLRAVPGTVDPALFIDFYSALLSKPDAIIGMLLNQNAATSKYVPTTATMQDIDWSTYEYVPVDVVLNSTFSDDKLVINTSGTQTSAGFYGSKVTVTYGRK